MLMIKWVLNKFLVGFTIGMILNCGIVIGAAVGDWYLTKMEMK